MAQKSYGSYLNGSYTEGNTARKIEYRPSRGQRNSYVRGTAAPARRYEEEEIPAPVRRRREKPLSKRQIKEMEKESSRAGYKRMQSESMSLGYVVFLSVMVILSVFLSVKYLNYQADISAAKSNINALKSGVEVQASQNDAVSYDIDAFIDINRIISVATNELGMVMANEDQIKYFQKHVDEFMNQYADVPEE